MIATGIAVALLVAQAAPSPKLLTLDDAVRRAQAGSLDLQAARARLDQAQTAGWKTWSYYLPQVTATGSRVRNNAAVNIDFRPLIPEPIPFQPLTITSAQAQVTQALVAPSLWFGIAAAQAGERAAAQGTEAFRREVLFGVSQLYFGAVGGKLAVQITEKQLAVALDHERDAKVRYQAGSTPKVALLRAEIDRAKAEQDLKAARAGYDSARSALATAVGTTSFDFDVEVPAQPATPSDAAALESTAGRDRPDVQAAGTLLTVAERSHQGVLASYLPTLGAFGRYSWQDPAGLTGKHGSWIVGLSLNWTLLDGTLREANLKESSAKVAEADANLQAAQLRARDEVRRAQLDADAAIANREKAKETVDLARENQRLVEVNYKAGAATYLEATDANNQLLTAELANVAEDLKARLAVLKLLKVAGRYDPR